MLVTGAAGILGAELLRCPRFADAVGTVHATPSTARRQVTVDLRDRAATSAALDRIRPRAIVHTVGLTDVDGCERRPGDAYATSVLTTLNVAEWAAGRSPDTLVVYISSDQVYSGDGPHCEGEPAPVNAYGAAKHAGELAAARAPRSLSLRTNFYGRSHGARRSFTDWIESAVRAETPIELDEGAWFSPLHLTQLATLVADVIDEGLEGVYNAGSHDGIDKISFARGVAERVAAGAGSLVHARAASPDPSRAPRPLDLRLDVAKLEAARGVRQPTVEDGLRELEEADGV